MRCVLSFPINSIDRAYANCITIVVILGQNNTLNAIMLGGELH